ncbi:MAG: small metal-binding protein SmbP [Methylococcales bacterium]|nr:small metal-binding protein SmbP [Methylococcales bacterium]
MKKLTFVLASLLFVSSYSVFAEKTHTALAFDHANMAVAEGSAGNALAVVKHAEAAIDHVLPASLSAKGASKNHLNEASDALRQAIDHGNLGHANTATVHAQAAVDLIKAGAVKEDHIK